MASQGPLYAGTVTSPAGAGGNSGNTGWSNASSAAGSADGGFASVALSSFGSPNSTALLPLGFGFTIPNSSTINGVYAELNVYQSYSSADTAMNITKISPTPVGTNHAYGAALPTSAAWVAYGGSTDLWGLTLSPADVNSPNFGLYYTVQATGFYSQVYVDSFRITVYYTAITPSSSRRNRMMV